MSDEPRPSPEVRAERTRSLLFVLKAISDGHPEEPFSGESIAAACIAAGIFLRARERGHDCDEALMLACKVLDTDTPSPVPDVWFQCN